ncbi:hypothetical protein [Ruthenibacterium lactatiformans]|uniref:hypothetical protein n=1 Tax=Ruthenibacterium lactatiformans TaxID=1550024 RepID=UPI003FD73353
MNTKDDLCKALSLYGVPQINNHVYEECANFLFLTSLYEERYFDNKHQHRSEGDRDMCKKLSKRLSLQDFKEFDFMGEHYCKRYIKEDGTETHSFKNLRLPKDYYDTVKDALVKFKTKDQCSAYTADLLFAYIMIVYRYRNNMFHGSKGIINLENYIEQFEINNLFMCKLIEKLHGCGMDIGKKGKKNVNPNLR